MSLAAPTRTPRARQLAALLAFFCVTASSACEMALTRQAPYGTVRVQANSRSGVPLPNIAVTLYTGRRPMGYARTDALGRAVFRDVPPDEYGLQMSLPDAYADLSELSAVPPGTQRDGISVSAGRDTTISFTFARRGLGGIAAQTRDSAGVGIAGLSVTFYRASGVVGTAITNADGFAELDSVPMGQYGAALQPPDSLGVPGAAFAFRDGLVVDRDLTPLAVFTLATCRGSITVNVRDQFDAAISGIEVTRYSGSGPNRSATTNAAGTASFALVPCGEHGVFLQSLDGFTVNFVRDSGYVDGLVMTHGASLTTTLRATRN